MIIHDIYERRGVCVVDPTNDLVKPILDYIPRELVSKTIHFDTSTPVALDFFSYHDDDERQILVDDLVSMFKLDSAPIAEPILMEIIGILLDANENGCNATFFDIDRFARFPKRQAEVLSFCSDERKYSWKEAQYTRKDLSPIVGRMRRFNESKTLRKILDVPKTSGTPMINIWEVMQTERNLLVTIKDTQTDYLIASLIFSKFQQATFRRRLITDETKRIPYYLYIDECDTVMNYAVKTFGDILTRARKYKLCLTMANVLPSDVPEPILRKFASLGTLVLFQLTNNEARYFNDTLLPYDYRDLTNLPKFHAFAHTAHETYCVQTPKYLPPPTASYAQLIKDRTKADYPCNSVSDGYSSGDVTAVPLYSSPKEKPQAKPDPEGRLPPDKDKRQGA